MTMKLRLIPICALAALAACAASASDTKPPAALPPPAAAAPGQAAPGAASTYVLGPEDVITIFGIDIDEFANKPVRIDANGDINLPMVGVVHAGGLTVREFEGELAKRLSAYVRQPQVTVTLTEMHSQPISVVGAVNTPGVQQLQGRKTLLEAISQAGGLRQDAGYSVRVSREMRWGKIPLPDARLDPSTKFSSAEISVHALMEAKEPGANIQVMPNDVITVPRAELVYVIGEVKKSGGFALGEKQNVSVLQALSLAEGLNPTANQKAAKILRTDGDSKQRKEIPVDVKKILTGQINDVPLQSDDILFIPSNKAKAAGVRVLEAVIQTASGVVIFRGGGRY